MTETASVPEKIVKGRLSHVRGKYVLTAGRRKVELAIGPMLTEREAKSFLGKDVAVAFSKKSPGTIVAIGKWPVVGPRCYFIYCYFPVPPLRNRLNDVIRREVLAELQKERIISPELSGRIGSGIGR